MLLLRDEGRCDYQPLPPGEEQPAVEVPVAWALRRSSSRSEAPRAPETPRLVPASLAGMGRAPGVGGRPPLDGQAPNAHRGRDHDVRRWRDMSIRWVVSLAIWLVVAALVPVADRVGNRTRIRTSIRPPVSEEASRCSAHPPSTRPASAQFHHPHGRGPRLASDGPGDSRPARVQATSARTSAPPRPGTCAACGVPLAAMKTDRLLRGVTVSPLSVARPGWA